MIKIILSDKAYENDVYPLVKAFYPEESIKVYSKEEYTEAVQESVQSGIYGETEALRKQAMNPENSTEANEYPVFDVSFSETEIALTITQAITTVIEKKLPVEEYLTKTQYKNAFKRLLYSLLSDMTGKTLPWGILTGIRPTKLVYEMMEKGQTYEEIEGHMRTEYLCSEEKLALSFQIAHREMELLEQMDYRKGYSLYIGIPFCPTTCLYCSFTSYSIAKFSDLVEDYLTALEKEIEYAATCFPGKKLTTVYFGGGTPTTLTADQLDRLLSKVREIFDFTHVKEFCVEAGRPDSITKDKLLVLKRWGVNRISINPQTMQQRTLDLIGRRHRVEEIIQAVHLARETGHDNINMDIIIGLPGENPSDVEDTLKKLGELEPESLTVHTLALKRAARLNIEKDNYVDLKALEVPKMLELTMNFAKSKAYLPYYLYRQKNMSDNLENIGYAKFGKEGLYNILIMEEKQTILALGAGGMSKFVFHEENRIERVDNVKSVTDYISRIDELILRKRQFLQDNPQL